MLISHKTPMRFIEKRSIHHENAAKSEIESTGWSSNKWSFNNCYAIRQLKLKLESREVAIEISVEEIRKLLTKVKKQVFSKEAIGERWWVLPF